MAREPESAAFEPVRVTSGSRLSSGLLGLWLAGLIGIVGIATANMVPTEPAEASAKAVAVASASATAGGVAADRPIAILDVAESQVLEANEGQRHRRIEVAGRLLVRADRVRVTLEGREDRILATIVRHPMRLPPRAGPIMPRVFVAAFELPAWRSGGMWITVTAFDDEGQPMGRIRQRVEVYPLEAPA